MRSDMRLLVAGIITFCFLPELFPQPEGYYDPAIGKSGEQLKSILHELIDEHKALSYAALWSALLDTDEDPSDPNRFLLIYTGRSLLKTQVYPDWNREHVWAKSHGGFDNDPPAGTDLHHIKPSDVSVNTDRGNKDFDFCSETGTRHSEATDCYYTSYAWEPGDNIKGDVARMMFYMAVRYNGDTAGEPDLELREDIPTSGPYFGRLSSLLVWHNLDPPDAFEIRRNNRIYEAYQGNRNPFIDHPEFAELIWTGSVEQDTIAPVIDSLSVINESLITVYYSEDV
ncbi:MAG TPA: hypothetical protein ENN61_02940, partial [Bacteroidaceae bacterium]|nr:hypothetical protein [Bacteroidaceae bacterium]